MVALPSTRASAKSRDDRIAQEAREESRSNAPLSSLPDPPDRAVTATSERYAKEFIAGWAMMDMNGHMANTAYLDLAADVRIAFFAEHGFPPSELRRLAIGPVIRKDEIEFRREIGLHDRVTVTYLALAMSEDGARFIVQNDFHSASGELSASLRSTGGWLDLRARKLIVPPPALRAAFEHVPRGSEYVVLPPKGG